MFSNGDKIAVYEPMCIFIDMAETERMRQVVNFLKKAFGDVICESKISKKTYEKYLRNIDFVPFYTLGDYKSYLERNKLGINWNIKDYVYGMMVMDGWTSGTVLRIGNDDDKMNIFSDRDIPYEVMVWLKLLAERMKPVYLNKPDSVDLGEVVKKITECDYLKEFEKQYDKFSWLLEKYTPNKIMILEMAWQDKNCVALNETLVSALNEFPEDEVNLKMNVSGYNEYFDLLEVYGHIHTNT